MCLVWAVCLINTKVYSINIPPEVEEALEVKYATPTEYDVKVEASKFGNTIKLYKIRVSIEDVLYSDDPLLSINFIGEDTKLKKDLHVDDPNKQVSLFQKSWNTYRDIVRSLLKVFLYFSAAALITILLLIGLIVVKNVILSGRLYIIGMKSENESTDSSKREKEFIQEWIKATFLIAFIVLIIVLLGEFANLITDSVKDLKVEEKKVTIYVQGDGNKVKDFHFKTNLEGYCNFMTQFNWEEYGGVNFGFMVSGFLLTLLKFILYTLLFLRMIAVGGLIIVSPIIILINSYMKIDGDDRPTILKNWIKWYLILALLRPVISIVYYVIFKFNPISFARNPLYIALLYAILVFAVYWFFKFTISIDVDDIRIKK